MNSMQTGEIEISSIQNVNCSAFDEQFVEDIDIVNLTRGNPHHRGNRSVEVEQGMQFHRPFPLAELRPGEKGQAQVDSRGIESVNRLLQFQAKVLVSVKLSGLSDKNLGKVRIDAPISHRIGIGQGVSGHLTADPQVIEFRLGRPQTGFDVAQALPISKLRKGQAKKLVPARKRLDLVMALIPFYALAEFVSGKKIHQLGKYRFAGIHRPSPFAGWRKYGSGEDASSNRKIPDWLNMSAFSKC